MSTIASSELEVVRPAAIEVRLTDNDLELIRRQINPVNNTLPDKQTVEDFGRYCMAQRLNPFDRQIYLAKIGGKWQPFIGVHGRLAIAMRTGEVDGMEGPYYCHKREGIQRNQPPDWDELWDDDQPPHAAKFVVYRKGWTRHPVGIAPWKYYGKNTGTWTTNAPLMLGYKAITRALNLVFPDVMPPAPDSAKDEPDVDESQGYTRDPDVVVATATERPPEAHTEPSGAFLDAHDIGTEFNLTAGATLARLRTTAIELGVDPPTSLDTVPAEVVKQFRSRMRNAA